MVIKFKKWLYVTLGILCVLLGILYLSYGLFAMDTHEQFLREKQSSAAPAGQINPKQPMLALTFDDGPYAPSTCRILRALQKVQGRATFFVVGSRVNGREDTLCKIQACGCEIGNHTFDHVSLRGLSDAAVTKQISEGDAAIAKVLGHNPTLVRPPGGAYNKNLPSLVGGRPIVLWTLDTMDWSHQNTQKTVDTVLKNARDGEIILLHDLFLPTAEAVEILAPELTKRGFQLVTVSELLRYRQNTDGVLLP